MFTIPDAVRSKVKQPQLLFIDGSSQPAADGATFDVINPATGAVLSTCAAASAHDVSLAVRAARKAFRGPWSRVAPNERSRILWRIAELIERDADALAYLETVDNGKPLASARSIDIPFVAEIFRYYAGWPTKLGGETIPVSGGRDLLNYTVREPVGVVGAIVPWNYPLMMAGMKVAPALAAGNTCVLKPAEQTPLTALALGAIAAEAGVPAGVLNIVPGFGDPAGAALASHLDVNAVVFTGSTSVGREIVRASAGNLKRVGLELGGKSPDIICRDADLDGAIEGAANGIFPNMGQNCSAGTRVFAERSVYRDVVDGLAEAADRLVVGDGLQPGTDLGPVVSSAQLERVSRYVEQGVDEGARIAAGGRRPDEPELASGYFYRPTVLSEATNSMVVSREEIFGPVVAVIPFDGIDDALEQANASAYGLGAGIWTRDIGKAHRAAVELDAGMVWVNCYDVTDPASPFGGRKASGYGHDMGRAALDDYTQLKNVWISTPE